MDFFGIQFYSSREVEITPDLLVPTPYESMETTNKLIAAGVVFFRDSEHAQGAFSEVFVGDGFYTQVHINEKTGEIVSTIMANQPCVISRVFPDGVTRVMQPIAGVKTYALMAGA